MLYCTLAQYIYSLLIPRRKVPPVAELKRTPLYEEHVALGARMVPFAGWEMPVQYEGIIEEHKDVRSLVGVFDVSHMPQGQAPRRLRGGMMIEPTETEPLAALDAFADVMLAIAEEAASDPELVKGAPHTTPVRRLDEAGAARNPVLRWSPVEG